MRTRRSAALALALARAFVVALVLPATLWAAGARADVGFIIQVGEGFDQAKVRAQTESNVSHNVPGRTVILAGCGAAPVDADCIAQLVAATKKDLEEVAVVTFQRKKPDVTEMTLRVFGAADWKRAVVDVRDEVKDTDAGNGTVALLRRAFDPARYSGRLVVDGAPPFAELTVDGLALDEPVASLSVGRHQVEVKNADGRVFSADVDIEYGRAYHLAVPVFAPAEDEAAPSASGAWQRWLSGGILLAGGATLVTGSLVEGLVVHGDPNGAAYDNWRSLAHDPFIVVPSSNDPACPPGASGCAPWIDNYGTVGGDSKSASVTDAGRFTMLAVARQNELGAHAIEYAAVAAIAGGAVVAVAGAAALAATLLAPEPVEAAPAETAVAP